MGYLLTSNCWDQEHGGITFENPNSTRLKQIARATAIVSIASLALIGSIFSSSLEAYTGGPTRAYIAGLDKTTNQVFYWRTFHGQLSGSQLWFFDLDGESPEQPQYVPFGLGSKDDRDSIAIMEFHAKLVPLKPLKNFDLSVKIHVDSIGRHREWTINIYKGWLEMTTDSGLGSIHELTIYCEPLIMLEGLYAIPGRREAVAIVTCIGDAYGCEEADQPVLLRPGVANPLEGGGQGYLILESHSQPFEFGRGYTGCCGGAFLGTLYEGGEPNKASVCYLELDYQVFPRFPEFWIINLLDSKAKPILFEPCGKDSAYYGREIVNSIRKSERRRGALFAQGHAQMRLSFSADSIGTQEDTNLPVYDAHLLVETPDGSGACTFTALCEPTISVRGVYPLPHDAKLVIVAFNAEPLACDKRRREAVVWDLDLAYEYTFRKAGWGKKQFPVVIYPNR